ncbi:hypothetical protein IP92_02785 [Pseudoduganella flava]|uniref:DUF5666 domain-containing protein n=1 Tax=Pseudoduganella flava TaxID=871742 RepID=A0A562PTG2_9BURK|nr:DUF6152 family protein [Pseudoduganella flava]QGZ39010.1 hypothetical protein GO485_08075 [Pseudoduganella flava]TWI47724.1 hypothetical protein IP92_02785 [Pseudoduganella flava]
MPIVPHLRFIGMSAGLAVVAATALAHHGWSEYDADKPLTLTGTIAASGYTQPHGHVELKTADRTWHVVLAPPSRMESRGLPKEALAAGGQATVYGYPHRTKAGELRAERITVKDKTTELR